jgi:DNA-directed RNA polymerase subunit RPC12/RpoP
MGSCTVVGLLPAIIFLYFGVLLQKERMALQALAGFLYQKQRTSVREAAQQFGWTDQVTEDKIVAALSDGIVQGHFDRGTKEFYVLGSQQNMVFVERCKSCGANVGMWLQPWQPAKCPYCGTDPRGAPPPTMPSPPPPAAVGAQPPSGGPGPAPPPLPLQAPATPPTAVAATPIAAQPQARPQAPAGAPATQPGYPPQSPPQQAPGASFQQPRPKKTTVRFLFFSLKPGAMKTVGFILLGLGILFVAAMVFAPMEAFTRGEALMCGSVFYLPPLLIGAPLVWKAYVHDRYKSDLLDVVDYIVTYRHIPFQTLAQKMGMPEARVRVIVGDILGFGLIEGQVTPDGNEFVTKLRPEDTQSVVACPYCKHPAINVQVIRGGSEKCPYCKSVIYFIEGARR